MEQFAAWHEKTGTVIRPVQAVSEDIFIRTVRPRRIVNCLTAPPRNILTYLLTYLLTIADGDDDDDDAWWRQELPRGCCSSRDGLDKTTAEPAETRHFQVGAESEWDAKTTINQRTVISTTKLR